MELARRNGLTSGAPAIATALPGVYPMTSQEAMIMLRQALLPQFFNHLAQDIRYQSDSADGATLTMFPFIVGPNGYSTNVTTKTLKLTRFFAESIRAIMRKQVAVDKRDDKEQVDFIPVLAIPLELSPPVQYLWTDIDGTAQPLYEVDPGEIPINIVDAATLLLGNPVYVDLNNGMLPDLVESHNNFMTRLSTVFSTLAPIGEESGIGCLNTVFYNLVQRPVQRDFGMSGTANTATVAKGVAPNPPKSMVKSISTNKIRKVGRPHKVKVGVQAVPAIGSDVFQFVSDVALLGVQNELKDLAKYVDMMVVPVFLSVADVGDGATQALQTYMGMMYKIPRASIESVFLVPETAKDLFPSAYSRHFNMATQDVHNALTGECEIEKELDNLASNSSGGFLSGIASALGSMFLGPEAGQAIGGLVSGVGL